MARTSPRLNRNARQLRRRLTEAEAVLWSALRGKQLACRYRRQAVVGGYIVDFACTKHRLIIECDGSQHFEDPADLARDGWFLEHGWTVLRFWNNEVLGDLDMVLGTVTAHCHRG